MGIAYAESREEVLDRESALEACDEVVERNLERMASGKRDGMIHFALGESMGGNAGHFRGLPCLATNFYYSPEGRIIEFSNSPACPEEGALRGCFKIALNLKSGKGSNFRIIGIYLDERYENPAKNAIERSAYEFNRRHGFEMPEKI